MRLSRRATWTLVAGTAVSMLAVLAVGSWWAVRVYGPALTRERVEAALATALDRPVRVERVLLRPWLGRFELRGVEVGARPEEGPLPLATVRRAWATVSVASLWRRELVVSRVVFLDLVLRYTADPDGTPADVPLTIPERIDLGPVTVAIRSVELRNARATLIDPAIPGQIEVDGADVTAQPQGGGLALAVRVAVLQLRSGDVDERIERLEAGGRLREDRLTVTRLEGRWRGERLRVAGDVTDLLATPSVALAVTGVIPLRPIAGWTGLAWPLEGSARVDGTLRGSVEDVDVQATVEVPRLVAGPVEARRVTGRLAWGSGVLRLVDVAGEALGGKVGGSLALVLDRPDATQLTVALQGVSLAALEPLVGSSLGAAGRLDLRGQLEGDLGRIVEARGRASLAATGLTLAAQPAAAGPATLSAEVRFADAVLDVASGQVRWPAIRVQVQQLSGRLDADGPRGLRGLVEADLAALAQAWGQPGVKGRARISAEANGRWHAPVVAGQADVQTLVVPHVVLDTLSAPFRLDGRTLALREARVQLGRSEARVSGTLSLPDAAALEASALQTQLRLALDVDTGALHLGDLQPWLPREPSLSGTVSATARVEGTPDAWRATGRMAASTLAVANERVEALDADVHADTRGVTVPRVALRLRGVPVHAEGHTTWTRTGAVRLQAGPVALERVEGLPPALAVRGLARARGDLTAREGVVQGSLAVVAERTSVADVPLGQGTLALRVDGPAVEADLTFPGAGVHGTLRGSLGGPPANVRLVARDVPLTPVLARAAVDAAGSASVLAELTVPIEDPQAARGTVRLDPLQLDVAGETWRSREAIILHREPGLTRVERAFLTSRLGDLGLTGVVTDVMGLDLSVDGRAPLAAVASFRPEVREADGVADLTVRVTGTMSAPVVSGSGTLTATRIAVRDVPEPLQNVRARFAFVPGAVRIVDAAGTVAGGPVTARGVIPLPPATEGLAVEVTGRLPLALAATFRPEIVDVDGVMDATVQVAGTLAAPTLTGSGTVSASRVVVRDVPEPIRDLRARLALAPGVVRIVDATGTVAGGPVTARGQIPLPPGSQQLSVDVTGRLPAALAARFRPEIEAADGVIEATLHVAGTLAAPAVTGNGTVSASRVVVRDVPEPVRDLRARFSLAPGLVRIADASATVAGGALQVRGQVPLPHGRDALALDVTGRLPLGILPALRPEIRQAQGVVEVAATVSGTLAEPAVKGQGTLTAPVLALRDLPETLRDVRARFDLTPGTVRLVEGTAIAGGGTLQARGEAALRGRAPGAYRFTVEGRNVSMTPVEGLHTTWDGDLELVGFETRAQLRGKMRLVRGSYTRDLSLLRLLLARDRPAPGATGPGLHLDLAVSMEDRLLVRTPVARFRAGGRLTIQGTSSAPVVFGTVNIAEGQLVFRKQVFQLTSAQAHFADPRRPDPILDVRGEARIRGYDVTLHLSGQTDDLQIRLTSAPPLPEEDVLALVAFGATREQLGRSGGAVVAGEAAGFLIQELLGVRAERAGLDVFEVETPDEGGRALRVGKQITPRTLIVFTQGLEDPEQRKIRVEYQVFGPVLIAGEQDFRGGMGGDVVVRFRFR